jgi:hypothetical protein
MQEFIATLDEDMDEYAIAEAFWSWAVEGVDATFNTLSALSWDAAIEYWYGSYDVIIETWYEIYMEMYTVGTYAWETPFPPRNSTAALQSLGRKAGALCRSMGECDSQCIDVLKIDLCSIEGDPRGKYTSAERADLDDDVELADHFAATGAGKPIALYRADDPANEG